MGRNEPDKENRRFFAIASFGKDRWYWVVWPSLGELQASEEPLLHVDEGYERSKAKAAEKALALAGMDAEWVAAKYAKAYHRSKADTKREADNHGTSAPVDAPVTLAFLYRYICDAVTGEWVSMPHRIVKKTKKYVYVEQRPYSPDDLTGSWLDQERPTFRLDRQTLAQEGYAFIPVTAYVADTEEPIFFDRPRVRRLRPHRHPSPQCLDALNLSWPCTLAEVREAYRRLVKQVHPDGGGNHDKFLALQDAYEQALRMCH